MTQVLLIALLAPSLVFGYTSDVVTKTAGSDGLADTQAMVDFVDARNEDGWVMTVGTPAGSYTWPGVLTLTLEHSATLQGASAVSRPTITSTVAGDVGIDVTLTDGKLLTVKDFVFNEFTANKLFRMFGSGADTYHLTNVLFTHVSLETKAVHIGDAGGFGSLTTGPAGPYGVIDNCTVNGGGPGFYFMEVGENWRRPMTWGTKYAHYVEDCLFDGLIRTDKRPVVDGWSGTRVVFRYNTVTNGYFATHGSDTAGPLNSALQHEVVHNTFITTDNVNGTSDLILIKGGSWVIAYNTFTVPGSGYQNQACRLSYLRADGGNVGSGIDVDRFHAALSTTIAAGSNGANLSQGTIYVASTTALGPNWTIGQMNFEVLVTTSTGVHPVTCTGKTNTTFIGCSGGTGTMSTGGAVTKTSDYVGTMQPGSGYTGATGADPKWPAEPWGVSADTAIYYWGNSTLAGNYAYGEFVGETTFMQLGRDYFFSAKPGYTEYTYPHPLRVGGVSPAARILLR